MVPGSRNVNRLLPARSPIQCHRHQPLGWAWSAKRQGGGIPSDPWVAQTHPPDSSPSCPTPQPDSLSSHQGQPLTKGALVSEVHDHHGCFTHLDLPANTQGAVSLPSQTHTVRLPSSKSLQVSVLGQSQILNNNRS